MKISVLMPVYNTKTKYLKESIKSILSQTYTDFEFIILDDGSESRVGKVIKSFKDKRIRYIHKVNTGIADTLNQGLDLAKGEFIARMDADDISLPQRFEKQVAFLENNPSVSAVGASILRFQEDYGITRFPYRVKCEHFLKGCVVSHPAIMFRKADFAKNGLRYDPDFSCEDYELWSRATRILKFVNLQDVLLCYRINDQSICQTRQEILEKDSKRVRANLHAYFDELPPKLRAYAKKVAEEPVDYKKRYCFKFGNKHLKLTRLNRKIAVVDLKGRGGSLGDQMFQYAFGKALELKYGLDVRYDESFYSNQFLGFNCECFPYELYNFPNLDIKLAGYTCTEHFKRDYWFKIKNSLFKHVKNKGYFKDVIKDDSTFAPYESELRKIFQFGDLTNKDSLSVLHQIQNTVDPICVDASEYATHPGLYKQAIRALMYKLNRTDLTLFIFNDENKDWDLDVTSLHVPEEACDTECTRMQLMSSCKHAIITDSSNAWWSAWLIDNPSKQIIQVNP